MPFPTNTHLEFSAKGPLPRISFSVAGNQISPTACVVGVSNGKVQPGQEPTVSYIELIPGIGLDSPQQIKGNSVQQVADLDGRALKWIVGLTSLDQLDAPFRMQVKCGQDSLPKVVDEPGQLDHGVEVAHGYIFVTVV
jgi:hypothetical protein